MDSAVNPKIVKRNTWIVWSCMFGCSVFFALIVVISRLASVEIARIALNGRLSPTFNAELFLNLIRGLSLALSIAALVGHRLFATRGPLNFTVVTRQEVGTWAVRNIFFWAMAEAVSMLGLILSALGFDFLSAGPFFLLSFFTFFVTRPSFAE